MAEVGKKTSEVQESLDSMSTSMASLTDLVGTLEDKLSSVMLPQGPSTSPEKGQDRASGSSLRMMILEFNDMVKRNRDRVRDMIDRLDL